MKVWFKRAAAAGRASVVAPFSEEILRPGVLFAEYERPFPRLGDFAGDFTPMGEIALRSRGKQTLRSRGGRD
jgi:hypothetical protein